MSKTNHILKTNRKHLVETSLPAVLTTQPHSLGDEFLLLNLTSTSYSAFHSSLQPNFCSNYYTGRRTLTKIICGFENVLKHWVWGLCLFFNSLLTYPICTTGHWGPEIILEIIPSIGPCHKSVSKSLTFSSLAPFAAPPMWNAQVVCPWSVPNAAWSIQSTHDFNYQPCANS